MGGKASLQASYGFGIYGMGIFVCWSGDQKNPEKIGELGDFVFL